jgi:hypothetical protein
VRIVEKSPSPTQQTFLWSQVLVGSEKNVPNMINRFPPDAAREAASTLIELNDLWKADVLVGSEIADNALDEAAYDLYRSGVLDDLLRRVSRTIGPI